MGIGLYFDMFSFDDWSFSHVYTLQGNLLLPNLKA